jgi:hypothetical protein
MPDTYTYMILGYGILMGGLMVYVISLAVRQYLMEQKKRSLLDESKSRETPNKDR